MSDPVADALSAFRRLVPLSADHRGPVPLSRFFAETGLDHVELPDMTCGVVADYLRREGVAAEDIGNPADKLAGFVFRSGRVGWAFVNAAEIVGRRRFTAAHELGHFVLHRETMGRFRADTDETLQEADGALADQMEREANRFAAELLMPEEVCRRRAEEFRRRFRCCPRGVLAYRLMSELLVSREALRYRLQSLEIGDE